MVRKRFFGHISGTEPPRTKIFALLGSSYMTRPWGNIKFFGALGAFVDFKKHSILSICRIQSVVQQYSIMQLPAQIFVSFKNPSIYVLTKEDDGIL